MKRIFRMVMVLVLAACLGGRQSPVSPDFAQAQTAPPKPPTNVKMPPAIPLNTQGIAGQVVGVLPSTLVTARDSLIGKPPFVNRTGATQWVDSLIGEGLMMRAPEVNWKLPAQMRSMARRAPGIAADPDYMGQSALRNPEMDKVPDPLISNLRTLMAIAGGRFVLVPAALSFQHDSAGAVEARVNLAGVDTRVGTVIFRSYIIATGATPAAALDSVMQVLLPTIAVDQ
ncbi:MAG TPA: hypothetical protein PK948_07460 [Gemmatimonadales bacterium]|nr:hypothetical protein [Gemmatimonadales bacterium]